jgi:hypothetical protein
VGAGTIGDVSEDLGPVLELNPVDTVGKRLHHDPLHEWGALGHEKRLYQTLGYPNPELPTRDPQAGPLPRLRRGDPSGGWGGESQLAAPLAWPLAGPRAVRIKGPLSVIATVCSK